MKRVVNTFLQLLDGFQSNSLFIAATNHEQLLDKALWRRFDDILFFNKPAKEQIPALLRLKLRYLPHKINYDNYVEAMVGWSHADIEHVCTDAMKRSVLAGLKQVNDEVFTDALNRQLHRATAIRTSTGLEA